MLKLPNSQNVVKPQALLHVVALSPHQACWQCEKPLPLETSAVLISSADSNTSFVCLICSQQCANALLGEPLVRKANAQAINSEEFRALLSAIRIENPLVVLGWRTADRPWYMVLTGTAANRELARLAADGSRNVEH